MRGSIIFNRLMENAKKDSISFHVPGHKYGKIYEKYSNKNITDNILSLDVTEIPGTDNLHAPDGMIKDAQDRAAGLYGADHTFFLINGTSTGIISMLMAVGNPKDKIIIPRDCHKSVIHGLILGDLEPIYMCPKVHDRYHISMGITVETVKKAIIENPDAVAVLLTYPNYYGICSDMTEIAKVVHQYDKLLIVDEAHGAHLHLSERLPISALEAGADIVVQSTHKTLPAFTQSSMLHVKSRRVDMDRLKFMLQMNQSSSPSYLLMTSLDMAMTIVEKDGPLLMDELLKNIDNFHEKIATIDGIKLLNEEIIGNFGVAHMDRTKLVIDMMDLGLDGVLLEEILRKRYNIVMEMATLNTVVGVASIANDRSDFEKLIMALIEIKNEKEMNHRNMEKPPFSYNIPKIRVMPRDAVYGKKREISFKDSVGKISGEYITPYPPGIPILCPGEEITRELIAYVHMLKKNRIQMIGTNDRNIDKILVIDEKQ